MLMYLNAQNKCIYKTIVFWSILYVRPNGSAVFYYHILPDINNLHASWYYRLIISRGKASLEPSSKVTKTVIFG